MTGALAIATVVGVYTILVIVVASNVLSRACNESMQANLQVLVSRLSETQNTIEFNHKSLLGIIDKLEQRSVAPLSKPRVELLPVVTRSSSRKLLRKRNSDADVAAIIQKHRPTLHFGAGCNHTAPDVASVTTPNPAPLPANLALGHERRGDDAIMRKMEASVCLNDECEKEHENRSPKEEQLGISLLVGTIDDIYKRTSMCHTMLSDIHRQIVGIIPDIGKLLARTDDIALLEQLLVNNGSVQRSLDELKESLPMMLAKFDQQLGDKIDIILRPMLREQVKTILTFIEKYMSSLFSSSASALHTHGIEKTESSLSPQSTPPALWRTSSKESNANKFLIQHRNILSPEAQTVLSRRLGTSPTSQEATQSPAEGGRRSSALNDSLNGVLSAVLRSSVGERHSLPTGGWQGG